jgi:serine/threonine-protein kinase
MARMSEPLSGDSISGETHISPAASQQVTVSGGTLRSTVLPQIEWEGPTPKVKPSERQRFEELGLLGEGGMGEVVLAMDHDIARQVALKRLPENCDLGRVLRFAEEIRTVGQLEHPNIVPVHDVGVDSAGRYYFVMKHLRGETLESIIARLKAGDDAAHARFTMEVRTQIFLSVLNAMAYAHQQGFIHRDLKPANIMVGPYGEVTVMDWGLAKRIRGAEQRPELPMTQSRERTVLQTQVGAVMGTPLYMSPEQARGAHNEVDERSDLYALTVIFHEFLHLDHYLAGRAGLQEVLAGVQATTPVLHKMNTRAARYQVPADLDWFLARGFKKAPAERYQSVQEMHDELQRIIRGECRVQCHRTFMKRMLGEAQRGLDRYPVAMVTASFAVLGLAGFTVVQTVASLLR